MSETPHEAPHTHGHKTTFSPGDLVMPVVGALLAAPLCDAGWHAIVNDDHIGRGVAAIVGGLVLGIGAGSFHWWSDNGRILVQRNAGWWLAVVVVLFFTYAVGPLVYQRAIGPTSGHTYLIVDPPLFEGNPLAWGFKSAALNETLHPPGSKAEPLVRNFYLYATNSGAEEVILTDAYLISRIDGATLPMKIDAQVPGDSLIPVNEAGPVPIGANFILTASFDEAQGGMPETEFLHRWSAFSLIVEYDGQKVRHEFPADYVRSQLDRIHPERQPHITRKGS
jgi:hypothetical protein